MELEAFLNGLLERLGADTYALLDWSRTPLLPWVENVHFIEEFRRANEVLDGVLGPDFIQHRTARRYLHEEPHFRFVMEPLLSAYLLVIVFTDRFKQTEPLDLARVPWTLDKVHSRLCELVRSLPTDGGTGGPGAAAQRLRSG